jgi:hypothetical protein
VRVFNDLPVTERIQHHDMSLEIDGTEFINAYCDANPQVPRAAVAAAVPVHLADLGLNVQAAIILATNAVNHGLNPFVALRQAHPNISFDEIERELPNYAPQQRAQLAYHQCCRTWKKCCRTRPRSTG